MGEETRRLSAATALDGYCFPPRPDLLRVAGRVVAYHEGPLQLCDLGVAAESRVELLSAPPSEFAGAPDGPLVVYVSAPALGAPDPVCIEVAAESTAGGLAVRAASALLVFSPRQDGATSPTSTRPPGSFGSPTAAPSPPEAAPPPPSGAGPLPEGGGCGAPAPAPPGEEAGDRPGAGPPEIAPSAPDAGPPASPAGSPAAGPSAGPASAAGPAAAGGGGAAHLAPGGAGAAERRESAQSGVHPGLLRFRFGDAESTQHSPTTEGSPVRASPGSPPGAPCPAAAPCGAAAQPEDAAPRAEGAAPALLTALDEPGERRPGGRCCCVIS
eukprot:TRINITY_DN26675_c0_g1_i1.p2 TRINITY_DN26675_c0_g1~~TRINITY_DN26675_c0_g1_i1.p2  ORF type:complete len:351 (+),score=84.66 TRINITY_DN26675_c0_g1_i1:74-1054(+)